MGSVLEIGLGAFGVVTRAGLAAALALAAAGCGDNLAPEVGSGTRLKITWFVYDDGTRQPVTTSLFDVQRDEPCAVQTWADGVARCTPPIGPFLIYEPVFTDASCADSVMYMGEDWIPPPYTADYAEPPRSGIERLRHLDTIALAEVWLRDDAGACVGPYAGTGRRFFRRGDEIPRGDFAEVVDDVVETGDRFAVRAFETYDGLHLPYGLHDTDLGFGCVLTTTAAGAAACLPGDGAALRYRDASCTTPLHAQTTSSAATPRFVADTDRCAARMWEVGAEAGVEPGFGLEGNAGACIAAAEPWPDVRWHDVTEHAVAPIERRRAAAPGRRLEDIVLVSGSRTFPDSALFDSVTGEECRTSRDSAGIVRCLPAQLGYVHVYYRDSACLEPLPLAHVYLEPPIAPCSAAGVVPRFAMAFDRADAYHPILARYTATPLYRREDGGACVDTPYDGVRWPPALHTIGEPVGETHFVAATRVTDP